MQITKEIVEAFEKMACPPKITDGKILELVGISQAYQSNEMVPVPMRTLQGLLAEIMRNRQP